MLKKILSVLLAVLMLVSLSVPFVSAQKNELLATTGEDTADSREKLGNLLSVAVEMLRAPDIGSYPVDACDRLEQAISDGYGVYYNPDATEEELDAQVKNVSAAIRAMQKQSVSEEAMNYLSIAISQAEEIPGTELDYTADSWARYRTALENAKTARSYAKSDEEVTAAADNLNNAVDKLELVSPGVVNAREYLRSMITLAYQTLDSDDKYTADSVKALEDEIETAENLYYNPSATTQQLYYEADVIVSVINLMEKIEISEEVIKYLEDVIAMADAQVGEESEYTEESWAVYAQAYIEAARVLNTGESNAEYALAADALGKAVNDLVRKDTEIIASRDALIVTINAAHNLLNSGEKFTSASVARLRAAIDSANGVIVREDASKQELDSEKQKIDSAMSQMEKITIAEDIYRYLTDVIALADSQVGEESEYTRYSWIVYKDAYENALYVLETGESDGEYVAAADALGEAIQSLVLMVDYEYEIARNDLKNALHSMPVGGNYTTESLTRLEDAISEGRVVYDNPDATVEEIRQQTAKIKEAFDNLEEVHIDEDVLKELYDLITSIESKVKDESEYTPESWKIYEDANHNARVAYYYGQSNEECIDAAQNLREAYDNLVLISELQSLARAELLQVINKAEETRGNFTLESWASLEDALNGAKAVYENSEATVEEIRQQINALNDALSNLEYITISPDVKAELENAIAAADVVDTQKDYTDDTWAEFTDAYDNAIIVLETAESDEELIAATERLMSAIDNLKVSDTDRELEEAREELLKALHSMPVGGNYTNESFGRLADAIDEGWVVYDNPAATVEEIRQQTAKIKEALDNLEGVSIDAEVHEGLYNLLMEIENADLDESEYTPESWKKYEDAIYDARMTYYYGQSDEEYIAATENLREAYENLKLAYKTLILGDTDLDGKVTIKDATSIQKSLAGIITLDADSAAVADANCDGVINIKDATEIQKHLASLPSCEEIGKDIKVTISQ